MIFKTTELKDVIEIQPTIFGDHRGYFLESYQKKLFFDNGIAVDFVQDNQSLSNKDVLRGLHYQKPPYTQGKLVKVALGSVLDIAVDLRVGSPSYGKHISLILSSEKQNMLWIPPGFAHGFLTLEDNTIFQYKCTQYYEKSSEETLLWNDPELEIDWGITNPIVSEKDKTGIPLKNLEKRFVYDR